MQRQTASLLADEPASYGNQRATIPLGWRFGRGHRYEVLSELGTGATSTVVLVNDVESGRKAAAKLMRPLDGESFDDVLDRAAAEAGALVRVRHENVVRAYDLGWDGDVVYLILDYEEGTTLERRLAREPLSVPEALDTAVDLARALEHAHAANVLHLDVKPGNVWLGASGRARLLDFGIGGELARRRHGSDATTSFFVGTPAYMAPEQWQRRESDARTDVWGLGATLYETLTCESPFAEGITDRLFVCEALVRPPPSVSARLRAPSELDGVLYKALARDPSERFQSAAAFCHALLAVRRAVRKESALGRSEKIPERRRRAGEQRLERLE